MITSPALAAFKAVIPGGRVATDRGSVAAHRADGTMDPGFRRDDDRVSLRVARDQSEISRCGWARATQGDQNDRGA